MEECSSDFACVADAQNLYIKWFRRVRGPAATAVNNLYTEYSPGVAKTTIDNRISVTNLSDLYNTISLFNISDSSAGKNGIKRQIV